MMTKNISGETINTLIKDEINSIYFSTPVSRGSLCIVVGLIIAFLGYLGYIQRFFSYILSLVYILLGGTLLHYAKFGPSLLIRFLKGDYFLKRGFLGRKVIYGNLTELKCIEMEMMHSGEYDYSFWLILKWKNDKTFVLGNFPYGSNARIIAEELCQRLGIEFVDKSQEFIEKLKSRVC